MRTAKANEAYEDIQDRLRDWAGEIVSEIAVLDAEQGKELLGAFVSELFLAVAEQSRREARREKQAEGIAAAKARGVRFGRPSLPLPDNFVQVHQDWLGGKISLRQAARTCGMSVSAFQNAAMREEQGIS